jgi:predicted transposase YdaD
VQHLQLVRGERPDQDVGEADRDPSLDVDHPVEAEDHLADRERPRGPPQPLAQDAPIDDGDPAKVMPDVDRFPVEAEFDGGSPAGHGDDFDDEAVASEGRRIGRPSGAAAHRFTRPLVFGDRREAGAGVRNCPAGRRVQAPTGLIQFNGVDDVRGWAHSRNGRICIAVQIKVRVVARRLVVESTISTTGELSTDPPAPSFRPSSCITVGDVSETNRSLDDLYHVYDSSMRLWAESNLAGVAGWLDPALSRLPKEAFVKLSTSFAVPVVSADLLIAAGPDRLMHVEYETSPDEDLVRRMYEYRGRIMRAYPRMRLTQYVIVLGNGQVNGFDDLETFGFAIDVRVIYVREHDPAEFLSDPVLAPFAVLARGSRADREKSLAAAMRLLRDSPPSLVRELRQLAEALARIRLDRSTIDRIGRENAMDIKPLVEYFKDQEWSQELIEEGRERGHEEGREEGRQEGQEEGREEGRERILLALLRTRFGDGQEISTIARRLAGWDEQAAAAAVIAASDPAQLLRADPPGVP